MLPGFDRCMCTPNARAFWERGQVYCVRCLAARSLLPRDLQAPELGVLGLFYRPSSPLPWRAPAPYPTQECAPGGCCWLTAIFPLARMTSGNRNFEQRLAKVASVLYEKGKLTKTMLTDLEVYERGCRWYPISGPVPGVGVYANRLHVSDQPFVGATHVLTNLSLPQNPCRPGFCPFDAAQAKVFRLHGKTIFISDEGYLWTHGIEPSAVEPNGVDRMLCRKVLSSLPSDHLVKCDFEQFMDFFSFTNGHHGGYLRIAARGGTPIGLCWARLFEDSRDWDCAAMEVDRAERHGYKLPYGVPGRYVQRRLRHNGLKAVVRPAMNTYKVWAFATPQSFIRHITLRDEPVEDFFVPIGEFSLCENTEVVDFPKFDFGRGKYYGYSPPGDGNCGIHCLSAVINDVCNGVLETTLPESGRPESEWFSDEDLYGIIMTLGLPVTIRSCPLAQYTLTCSNSHWTVTKAKKAKPITGLSSECVRGICGGNCKPVPVIPNCVGLDKILKVTPGLAKFSLGVEPYSDHWTYDSAVMSGDALAKEIETASGEARKSLKASSEDWAVLRDCMLEGSVSRRQVLDKLLGCIKTSSRVSLVPYENDSDDDDEEEDSPDFSVPGLLLAGSDSVANMAEDCHLGCFKALGTTRSTASSPTRDLAASMFSELVKPAEESQSKDETKMILATAIESLSDAAKARFVPIAKCTSELDMTAGPAFALSSSLLSGSSDEVFIRPVPAPWSRKTSPAVSMERISTMVFEREAPASLTPPVPLPRTRLPAQNTKPIPAPRTRPTTLVVDHTGAEAKPKPVPTGEPVKQPNGKWYSYGSLAWNPDEVGVKLVCVSEDVRKFLKDFLPFSMAITRAALIRKVDTKMKELRAQTPHELLAKVEDFAKNLDDVLLSSECRGIHGMSDTEFFTRLEAHKLTLPRAVGFRQTLADVAPKPKTTKNLSSSEKELKKPAQQMMSPPQEKKTKEVPAHERPQPPVPTHEQGGHKASAPVVAKPAESAQTDLSDQSDDQSETSALLPPKETKMNWKARLRDRGGKWSEWFNQQVFAIVSHLQAAATITFSRRRDLGVVDYFYTLGCLFCLLLCFYYPVCGFLPSLGMLTGDSWRIRVSFFTVWLSVAVVLFTDGHQEMGLSCSSATPDCQAALHHYTTLGVDKPVHTISVGIIGTTAGIFARLVGGSRYFWSVFLRLLVISDIGLVFTGLVLRGRCKKCLGKCVRCAPPEIPLKVIPASKIAKVTLLELCDKYSSPKLDIIKMATGYSGCWTGVCDPHQCSDKPVSFSQLDEKKLSSKTVVPPPVEPAQAIRCIRVLQAGGGIQDLDMPEVKKVSKVPYTAPFFPKVQVDPTCYVVVDTDTYTAAMRSGYCLRQLIIGIGDFAAVNNVKFQSGGYAADYCIAGCYVLVNFILNAWLTSPVSCGTGTHDAWCHNPFSSPVYGTGVMCNEKLCVSELGLTVPTFSGFGFKDWALGVSLLLTLMLLASKWVVCIDVVVIFVSLTIYVFPVLSMGAFAFPFVLMLVTLSPFTLVWVHFFLISVNPAAGFASLAILFMSWVLAQLTGVCGVITPYDALLVTRGGRNDGILTSAPEGTYYAAVRRAALTGRCLMFSPSKFGTVLEGSLRTAKTPENVVSVFGSCAGTGGVFEIDGVKTVVTASHLLQNSQARVSCVGFSECLKFDVHGDFASCRVQNWTGPAPKASINKGTGRAYWLTSSGVEPGFVGESSAFCFTKCGDSGSPVVDDAGNIYGVHTGSNKKGSGMITRPCGQTIGMNEIKLSEMSPFFCGPLVPVQKVPKHVVADVDKVPASLVQVLEAEASPEGALSSIQLLCVFFFLWRMIHHPWVPFIAMGFFVLNEILPAVLVRLLFSMALSVLSLFTPFSLHSWLIRMLTASLNRSPKSLWFFILGAVVSLASDIAVGGDISISTWCFVPRIMMLNSPLHVFAVVCGVHVLALVLSLFKIHGLTDTLVGNGNFDPAFFLKYFAEGNLRDGVTQSCGVSEGLTAAIATTLTEEDLEFIQRFDNSRCFVSASNMLNGANEYIEVAYAKALRRELAATDRVKVTKGLMAKLEAFISGNPVSINPGDLVVVLGRVPVGDVISLTVSGTQRTVRVEETRNLAGTSFSIGTVLEEKVLENSPGQGGCVLKSKKTRRAEKRGIKIQPELVEKVDIGGQTFLKMWDKRTGDVYYQSPHDEEGLLISENPKLQTIGKTPAGHFQDYIRKHGEKVCSSIKKYQIGKKKTLEVELDTYLLDDVEYDVPKSEPLDWEVTIYEGMEAERLTVSQALLHMGHDTTLTQKEKEKLQRIIDRLNGLVQEEALNLLATFGLDRCTRGGLTVNHEAVKIVRYHKRTFSFGDVNLKVMSFEEWQRTSGKPGHALVARLIDGVVVMRKHVPSMIDVLIAGEDTKVTEVVHGPGNTGVDGFTWDFEAPASSLELELTYQIVTACSLRRGDAPKLDLPYELHPVRGDPYRKDGVLRNTRFGNIPYKTPDETKEPLHAAACFNPKGVPVIDGSKVIATTVPAGFELYVPTIPYSVLDYLDSRHDVPKMYTSHGCASAAEKDLAKFDLSTQGFVFPEVLNVVRRYLLTHIGKRPAIYKPSNYPARNSMAGLNGQRFPTQLVQSHPDIDEICKKARDEVWQTVTPCTLKKQYCSKQKTRTILGTNNLIALGFRAALSGVTEGFMKRGVDSPIYLGKNKFQPLPKVVSGRCLEADLASCDRSTPAIVRWFVANLLFELANEEEWLKPYVVNCCHDVLSTMSGCVTKRGGLSSGDPVTSVSNTIYSLIIYTQHMVMSAFRNGHPLGAKFLRGTMNLEDCLQLQPVMMYSDDVVLYGETDEFPNYSFFVDHLDLMLGFKTDRKKTVITHNPNFLGCRILDGRYLVPQRDRVLAALAYHMKAADVGDYYCSASAILMDSCAAVEFDEEWFTDLVIGMAECARQDGYRFPGLAFFHHVWRKVSHEEKKKVHQCAHCGAIAGFVSMCGLDLCSYHSHAHPHCSVILTCGHSAGSGCCEGCKSPVVNLNTRLDQVLKNVPYHPPRVEIMKVIDGLTSTPPGRYQGRHRTFAVRRDVRGNVVDVEDGEYQVTKISQTCQGINMISAMSNILRSKFITGAPGTGKTSYLLSVVREDDVIYTPTHRSMLDIIIALGVCRFDVPKDTLLSFPAPSRCGPIVRLIGAGYVPARNSFLDEAGYCNVLDVLKILTCTPLCCVGDLNQLSPVGFDGPCFAFSLMPGSQLPEVYRFGPKIVQAIAKLYKEPLQSRGPDTSIIYQKVFMPVGQVLTPYHRDRVDGAITIDSSQGCTYDVVTLYLPTPKTLTKSRALVAITRARHALFIYDPHNQLREYFNLEEHHSPDAVACYSSDRPVTVRDGKVLDGLHAPAVTNDPNLKSLLNLEGTASPLPQVAYNLGFYYSPDLCQFARIPEQLCQHWPVVTGKNNEGWPDRLVCSMSRIHKLSKPIYHAGYYCGPSIFLGVPGVMSYYLTWFKGGAAQPLPDSLFSTGRLACNVREYLDDEERRVARTNVHAFIGEVKGTTVGGSHHITSKYLPRYIPPGSVASVGVSAPGAAAKSLCTVTDVYLPDIEPFLSPETASKDWKVMIDFRPTRLMVWRDGTAYFHEGISPMEPLSRFVPVKKGEGVYFDVQEFETNVKVVSRPGRVSVSPDQFLTEVVLSLTPPERAPPTYKLILGRAYRVPGLEYLTQPAFVYQREEGDFSTYNQIKAKKDLSYPVPLKGTGYMFPHG
nr:polyprotein 1ab [Arteriviridae sp.]